MSKSFNGMNLNASTSSLSSNGDAFIREGPVSTKEDGIRSMFFSKKYAILRQTALTFHKSKEVSLSGIHGR